MGGKSCTNTFGRGADILFSRLKCSICVYFCHHLLLWKTQVEKKDNPYCVAQDHDLERVKKLESELGPGIVKEELGLCVKRISMYFHTRNSQMSV